MTKKPRRPVTGRTPAPGAGTPAPKSGPSFTVRGPVGSTSPESELDDAGDELDLTPADDATDAIGSAELADARVSDPTSASAGMAPSAARPATPVRPATAARPAGAPGVRGSSATGSRATGGQGPASSRSAQGTPRAGRRPKPVAMPKSFMERHRGQVIGGGILAAVAVLAVLIFLGSTQAAYACSIQLDPASPAPSASGVTGQREDDMGRGHIAVGTPVTYTYCPPASGKHYNAANSGPIAPRFYGPDDTAVPQGWIHNLEHGGIAILYNCARSGCDTGSLTQLRGLVGNFPASPVCNIAGGLLSPVIARFDTMKANFAAVVWDRVLLQDTLDIPAMLEFFKNQAEKSNPEPQCNPSSSPGVSFGPTKDPLAPESEVPAVNPAPSASDASTAPSTSPVPSGT